jgi:hypothetical protein
MDFIVLDVRLSQRGPFPAALCWPTEGTIARALQAYLDHRNIQRTVSSAFRPTDPAFEPSLRQHQSLLSGNAILQARDEGAETPTEI